MSLTRTERQEVWKIIMIFLVLLTVLSAIAYYAILRLNPTSIYIGALMMSPALASIITLKISNRPISSLPWRIKDVKYLRLSYFTPLVYVSIAYVLIWALGLGDFVDTEQISEWSNELGIDSTYQGLIAATMVFLLLTVGVIKNLGSILGEEIGWRGFFIFELRKVLSFKSLSIVSGLVWAVWHFPIINLIYGRSEYLLLHMGAFTIMIIGISVILAYLTFRSNSLWPAALYHSVHNIAIQKVFTPLTKANDKTVFWIDEYGFMIPIITTLFAIYFWRKAAKENL
ncbi:MAG: CPBP family intramembrane metalloprotease [Flavobacteriales bacterium]|nr:CPBP family intramembrane metalloprotease [Flavobacteriales bacterium]